MRHAIRISCCTLAALAFCAGAMFSQQVQPPVTPAKSPRSAAPPPAPAPQPPPAVLTPSEAQQWHLKALQAEAELAQKSMLEAQQAFQQSDSFLRQLILDWNTLKAGLTIAPGSTGGLSSSMLNAQRSMLNAQRSLFSL